MATPAPKIGIITGGASGMGLAVAKALAAKGWRLHLFDLNEATGRAAESAVPGSSFSRVDVSSYEEQAAAFDRVFRAEGRLDFVFANAGIFEKGNFYDTAAGDASDGPPPPPPPPNEACIDVNLKGVIRTTYLAQHYFRRSPHRGQGATIITTASVGGIYPQEFTPLYAASKAGILHFTRTVARKLHADDGIRAHALCPAAVRTALLGDEVWSKHAAEHMTPLSTVTRAVEMLLLLGGVGRGGGEDVVVDSKGVVAGRDWGLVVELNVGNIYFRPDPEYCDDVLREIMTKTTTETMGDSHMK
ncbi:uncharacterized protein E0L32_011504 [Thyridium curvatum]|uniref:Uncharacterized protein n=1 Tax=Thyridium curvatum TaxID=1093900 RepID=A0A507B6P8_9PEZI|nr:uncharacterized protein E0L32_011504 [Thyridium curvatum]TPX18825.1 hypothetical protein E0L32_011504 [Thyridium curvatum]